MATTTTPPFASTVVSFATKRTSPAPGDSYVQSFARGLEVIRSFSAQSPRQTLSEVAGRTGLTRAGARRILLTLQTLGYVESDGKLFRLTARMLDLGFAYLSSLPIWNLAEPLMETLAGQVKESCSAAVLDGTDIVYVMRVSTHKIMSIGLGVGSRLPAYCTSMGRMLLSALPPDQMTRVLQASERSARTRYTVTDLDELAAKIALVRKQGWSLVNQELEEGLVSMAAAITDRNGQTVAALNISGQANRTSTRVMQDTMLPALLGTARSISQRLSLQRS
ncbi:MULTISPECIES: IclR family transcriptional regulator C-terminal domain-containing protein [unclassified Polaromonas]|uniref:IclR family transcriptional regulator domain-containing protein n=1 Tax=unclassified Polaromonas TaxID=2638319 RepID=UPI0018C9F984|nr:MULTISPECIES: IclR family transcriptional regulator C-terminal domain-containing protein [unclassified Polaromonas]MBG6071943.1 IclR family pca regulon transcriptional regulator [Polaromonas sp. CG_9.7]MBG6113945.1 IclR family pca regulon transcriptional regulator [Polaromonas sp. CG_9.2]MDH6183863.1 IclR family pca regulon transcriptional regulator [Polaromonas sp. CG_23.6]